MQLAENTNIRTIETIIQEAKQLALRVVHTPDPKPNNVVQLHIAAHERRQTHVSPEAA
jgi:hypothetical protein